MSIDRAFECYHKQLTSSDRRARTILSRYRQEVSDLKYDRIGCNHAVTQKLLDSRITFLESRINMYEGIRDGIEADIKAIGASGRAIKLLMLRHSDEFQQIYDSQARQITRE